MNATHLFEKVQGDRSLPPSSESFWTSMFALFLLHVARSGDGTLAAWQPSSTGHRPWYERMPKSLWLHVRGLEFDGITVELGTVVNVWREAKIDPRLGGVSPDILARILSQDAKPRFVLIENKVASGATLNANQVSAYPELIRFLEAKGIDASLFVLQPVGCSQRLYAATKFLQARLLERFGILLWEDMFRVMHRSGFSIPGFDTARLHEFTDDAARDCSEWSVGEA